MAVSSSPSNFNLVLSFSEEPACRAFADRLCSCLKHKVDSIFTDEASRCRKRIDDSLPHAIENSSVCIPIISESYTKSGWCMMGLNKMIESKKSIVPIFYGCDPFDAKHLKGPFEAVFREHRLNLNEKKVGEWKRALREVVEINRFSVLMVVTEGWENEAEMFRHESKVILLTVKRVLDECNAISNATKHPTGVRIGSQVEDVLDLLNINAEGHVKMIGIAGRAGMGKTTLAKAIYNQTSHGFVMHCFLSNISDAKLQLSGIISLQKRLISRLSLFDHAPNISSVKEGIKAIKEQISGLPTLIVLDGIDHIEQLQALACDLDSFPKGSRILITTRDEGILREHGINEDLIYHLHEASPDESLQIFSYYAFGRHQMVAEYAALSERAVSAIGRTPLLLQVLGSVMLDKTKESEWDDLLQELLQDPLGCDGCKLDVSYHSLDEQERLIFLDVACFLIGSDVENAARLWNTHSSTSHLSLEVLIQKSLLKIDEDGRFEMSDMVKDFGRQKVQETAIDQRSRVWAYNEALSVLDSPKGRSNVECMALDFGGLNAVADLRTMAFDGVSNLRMLRTNSANFQGKYKYMPSGLELLEWQHCPRKALPDKFDLGNIIVLNLSKSRIVQVWNRSMWSKIKVFHRLKALDLSYCKYLKFTPRFSSLPNLEMLNLKGCERLVEVHESIGDLQSLSSLNMLYCPNLKRLPESIFQVTTLKVFKCSGSLTIKNFTMNLGTTSSLEELVLNHLGITSLPNSIGLLTNLRVLSLARCYYLRHLPESIGGLIKLEKLVLSGCQSMSVLPDSIGDLRCLPELDLSSTNIEELSESIGFLENLKILRLPWCLNPTGLPNSLGRLTNLESLTIRSNRDLLARLPDTLKSLKELKLHVHGDIPDEIMSNSTKLEVCVLTGNLELPKSLKNWKNLRILSLDRCPFKELSDSVGLLEDLMTLRLWGCTEMESLPSSIGKMTRLQKLDLAVCSSLKTLPYSVGNLKNLLVIDLSKSGIEHLPDPLCCLEKLTVLLLSDCFKLKSLPSSIGNLTKLEELDLRQCTSLQTLADTIGNLKRLIKLDLSRCRIEELPDSIGSLEKLRELLLHDNKKLKFFPNTIGNLTNLIHLNVEYCEAIRDFPSSLSMIKNLKLRNFGTYYEINYSMSMTS